MKRLLVQTYLERGMLVLKLLFASYTKCITRLVLQARKTRFPLQSSTCQPSAFIVSNLTFDAEAIVI